MIKSVTMGTAFADCCPGMSCHLCCLTLTHSFTHKQTFVRGDTYVPKGAEKTGGAPPTSSSGSVYKLKSRKEPSEIERMMMEGGGGDGGGGSSKAFVDKKKVSE